LIATMKAKDTGTLIFRGPPGTGKTTFIRHLIGKLRRTHRFYYLPVTQEELLTSPQMVEFWVDENRRHAGLTKVVILEDAESLLENTGTGRKGAVANLLNISDGLLGELLKVQLLCTINCEVERLDEAIIRPGRLIGYREFPRLSRRTLDGSRSSTADDSGDGRLWAVGYFRSEAGGWAQAGRSEAGDGVWRG
jgi:SpoVK/Ycf46/Vps4 family AAA+-type ATPase